MAKQDIKKRNVECNNCDWIGIIDECEHIFPDIPNILSRIAPGEEVPACECPYCNALAHYRKSASQVECPNCNALVDVSGMADYELTNCHNCGHALEYDGSILIDGDIDE